EYPALRTVACGRASSIARERWAGVRKERALVKAAEIEAITLERSACLGTCPAYSVTLHRDGTAAWRGEMFTSPLGEAVGYIDGQDFDELAGFIERVGFFSWEPWYSGPVTCGPGFA